jgi:hypothetical protein
MDIKHGHQALTCRMGMQNANAEWKSSMDKQHEHAV